MTGGQLSKMFRWLPGHEEPPQPLTRTGFDSTFPFEDRTAVRDFGRQVVLDSPHP